MSPSLTVAGAGLRGLLHHGGRVVRRFRQRGAALERGGERSALIVGGPPRQRLFCASLLRALDLSVAIAEDWTEAERALRGSAYGLIILDLPEPVAATAARLKRLHLASAQLHPPQAYVVEAGDRGVIGRRGACRTIRRPLSAIHLVEAVARLGW